MNKELHVAVAALGDAIILMAGISFLGLIFSASLRLIVWMWS